MLELIKIKKSYKTSTFKQEVLNGINLKFENKEFVSILGASGSGKTTLLNIIGGLDTYDSGNLIINGVSTKKFKAKDWDSYRNNSVGFIFQSYNLISHMSILSNVELCMTLSGVTKKERKKRALEALDRVGLKKHIHKKPNQLSGGQMQRVAIARALVNDPDIILADEPTGALDSKTSVQIMKLIKEISEDKLVIMVTHNPELAKEYSNRIIELKDGEVISDSNECKKDIEEKEEYKLKKTSMNFFTALNLSFNNILTKKGRTILTSFASSIGIIGIALILSLSNGFQIQIDKFEKDTLSQAPIIISEQSINTNGKEIKEDKLESYTKKKKVYALKTMENMVHINNITKDYITYLENIDKNLVGAISYQRATKLNILMKKENKVSLLESETMLFPLPSTFDGKYSSIMEDNFEVIEGNINNKKEEILILVDEKNRIDSSILKQLGFEDKSVDFKELIGKEFKLVFNNDFYKKNDINFVPNADYENLYNNENNITLKISGIVRGKKDSDFAKMSGTGLIYNKLLMDEVISLNDSSEIVKAQKEKDYNVITLEKYDLNTKEGKDAKRLTLAYLGSNEVPSVIQLYPKDFNTKKDVLKYLDKFNKGKTKENKIEYLDQAQMITDLSGNIMDAITIVLIAFSAISLVVSSIMIGIIIYISVLERTKEIGVLRAIGARKKDITRVFNAETFIIGLASGILGIIIATLLTFPINKVIENLTDLSGVAKLNPVHALILVIISIVLTVIGGFIPSKIASKKDPVEALRTE